MLHAIGKAGRAHAGRGRRLTASVMAFRPLDLMLANSEMGVLLMRPLSVSRMTKWSFANLDTASIAEIESALPIGSTCTGATAVLCVPVQQQSRM